MATLRDLLPGNTPAMADLLPPTTTLRGVNYGPAVMQANDEAAAAGMGQLRRGFTTGRLQADANALAADESAARAAGDAAAADALRLRIGGLQQRSKTFAPTEQDVTQLDWQPGRILDYGLATMGQGAASMMEPLATGIGANAAAGVLGLVPHPLAQGGAKALRAGGILGGGYLNYRQNKGEFYNQAVEDPALMAGRTAQEIDRAGAGHGLVAGALDTALPAWAANRIVPGGTKVLSGLGGGMKAALGLGGEAVTETLQGESKRGILGLLNPQRDTSGDAAERWNDAVGGAIGAAPIVGLSHLGDKANARLGVKDDTSSDDVSGGKTMPGAPKREKLTDSLKRGAAKYTDDDAAEKWNETLQGLHNPDQEVATTEQHAALLKELGGRAAKGDTVAQQHIDALNKLDPADSATWYGAPQRDAAYEHILGDGTDHEKVIEAYKGRKLNAQGGSDTAPVRLAADILSSALPEDAHENLHKAAKDIARELAGFAKQAQQRGTARDPLTVMDTAQGLVDLYGNKRAAAIAAQAATALGVETSPLFKQLQKNIAGAGDIRTWKSGQRAARAAVGDQMVAVIPATKQLEMREEGVDFTSTAYKAALVDYVEQLGKAISYGATDAKGEPVVVPPSAYAKLTAKVGAEAAVAMLDMVAPGRVVEKTDVPTPENGGERTGSAGESDRQGEKRNDGLGDGLEMDDFAIDAAKKSMERAPGAKLYLTKGKRGVATAGDAEGSHPFVHDKKTGNLPKLSLANDTDSSTGFNTLEAMEERAFEMMGGDLFERITSRTTRPVAEKDQYGLDRHRLVREDMGVNDIENDDPRAPPSLGVGSFRIRRISAKDVMDDRGVAAGRRTTLLRQYLAQDGVMGEGDDTLTQLNTLNRKIKEAEQTTPKQLTTRLTGMRVNHGRVRGVKGVVEDNPAYAQLEELKAQRTEVIAKLAKKIGVEAKDDATVEDLANAYFGQRFLITAEQMAEKDQLRLNQAEVLAMIRKGNQYINKSTDPTLGPSPVEVQADMNLIRFRSKSAITKSDEKRGIAVIPASELVAWVFANRNDYKGVEGGKESALEYRNALMEGIGALAEGGYMDALPFMINAEGNIERFGSKKHGGFPPSLKLGGMRQADLNEDSKRSVAAIVAMDKVSEGNLAKMTPKQRAKHEAAAEKKRSDEVARDQDKTEKGKNTDPDELLAEGQERDPKTAARPVAQRSLNLVPPSTGKAGPHPVLMSAPAKEAPPARYWDAPAAEPTDPAIPTNPEFDNPLGTPDRRFVNGTEIQGDLPGMPEAPGATVESVRPSAVGVSRPGQKVAEKRSGRFPVAPETVETRRDNVERTQLDWDLKAQDGGVPTDFTAAQMAKAVADAALTEGETRPLTPTNATARAPALAREILWQLDSFDGLFEGKRVTSDVPADPQGAFQRIQRLVAALFRPPSTTGSLPAGGLHYAAPLALILTPANVKVLISKAQNKAAAGPRLERMRDKVARALLLADDNDLSLAGRVVAARALLGNDALTSATMKAPLKVMADREEKRLAAERERAAAAAAEQKAKIEAKKAGQPTRKLNAMSARIHSELGRAGFAATHDSPIRHGGRFDWRAHAGKGEGAMLKGAGTYLSTSDQVHGYYKKMFTAKVGGGSLDILQGKLDYALEQIEANKLAIDASNWEKRTFNGRSFISLKGDEAGEFGSFTMEHDIQSGDEMWYAPYRDRDSEAFDSFEEAHADHFAHTKSLPKEVLLLKEKIANFRGSGFDKAPTYEVSVNIPQEQLLNWDKPLSKQSAEMQKVALEASKEFDLDLAGPFGKGDEFVLGTRGEDFYRALSDHFAPGDRDTGDRQASDYLQAAGILGHRMKASAKDGVDRPNYVIYDDSKITTNYVHFNAEAATKVSSDADVAKAKAYLAKTLGPNVRTEVSKDFEFAGEYLEAENLIKLSTAIGPGVLSVAHHETLHAAWATILKHEPKAREALTKVLADGRVYERLKGMLANEPVALKMMAADPEERVAYAYQFWAAGELDVDKPATTLFAKFRKMLRKVLGMVRESEIALDIMTALHDGKLAEPSAAGRVLKEIMARETWNADVKRKFDKVIQNSFAAIAPSNDVLRRETLSGTARLLGKIMFSNPGEEAAGGDQGYLNARKQKIAQYTNYLHAALKGLSERDLAEVAKQLQLKTPLEQITYAPVRDAVKGVRALTKRYYEYATQKSPHGEPVLKLEFLGEDHYPRVWDLRKLVDDGDGQAKFIAMLLQPKYKKPMAAAMAMANEGREKPFTAEQIALKMYERLVEKNGVDDKSADSDRMDDDLLDPFFASQKERSFKWLDDADVEPFLDKDVVSAMTRYLHQGIRAVEFSRRFGERGKFLRPLLVMKGDPVFNSETGKVEPAETHGRIASEMYESLKKAGTTGKEADLIVARHMDDVRKAVAAHEGSLGHTISPTWRKFSSAAMAYQNLRLLPLSLLVAFGDTIGIAARFGEGGGKLAFQAFTQGLRDVYARWKDAASDMPAERQKTVWENIAEMVGAVDSHMFLEQMGNAAASEFTTDWARKANRALFMANGLTAWDRSMRISATKAAVLFLQHHASLPDKQHSARWLKELGLKVEDIPLDADGKLIYDRHVLAAEKGISLEDATKQAEKVHYAITRWVEGAVLTPTAGQRPTWASDPHYAVLFHLKQFTYSFHHTILKRAFNEAGHGNMAPIGALMMAVPTMVAADLVKGVVVGGGSLPAYMQQWDLGDHMMHGFNRAGLGGIGQFGIDGLRDPFSVLGPTAQQASEFILNPLDIGHNLHNAVPGARYIKGLPDLARVAE